MRTTNGADAIVAMLASAGIDTVFGIPGKYNMPLYEAVRGHPDIRAITVRHEQGAAFMADGYARASGRPAALLLLPGCGVTNALTGLGEAYWDSSPVLLIATQVDTGSIDRGRGLLHELPGQLDVMGSVCKFSVRIDRPDVIPDLMAEALAQLTSGRPRPVQIEVPIDVQRGELQFDDPGFRAPPAPAPPQALIGHVADLLRDATRPVFYAGGGVISAGASKELVRLAERLQAPVITTGMGAGSIAADHPLWCGVAWGPTTDIRPLVAAADAFVAVGTRFNEAMTNAWDLPLPDVTVRIDIDPDPAVQSLMPMSTFVEGDARAVLAALDARLGDEPHRDRPEAAIQAELEAVRSRHRDVVGSTAPWMDALRAALPSDGIIAADMTLFYADMLGAFPYLVPRSSLFPWGYGTLGFGVPAAIGAKLGCPERAVVGVVGDGAMLFTGAELATAVQYQLPIAFVVANNDSYGMIAMQQHDTYGAEVAVDLHNPDFVTLAEAFGASGVRVEDPDALERGLLDAWSRTGPSVIELPWGKTFDGAPR